MDQWIALAVKYVAGPNGGMMAMASIVGAGLYHRFILPARIKPLEERIIDLEERAAKYDKLVDGLLKGKLARLEDDA